MLLTNLHTFKIINKASLQLLSEEADFLENIQTPMLV